MAEGNSPILVIKKGNHRFKFWVLENGAVEYSIDSEEQRYLAESLQDGKILFKNTVELYIEDTVEFVDGLALDDFDFAILKAEQNLALSKIQKKKDEVKEWTLENKNRKELISMVDKWQKKHKTITRKENGEKKKEKYTVHTFIIGRENFRMIERQVDGKTIVNPDYKIFTKYSRAGGIACKEGELIVWKYYFEQEEASAEDPTKKKGYWDTARKLTFNEQICYEIIMRYGTYHGMTNEKRQADGNN